MSVSEKDVKRWFDTALKWGSANSAEKCRDTFECLEELASFLKDLESALEEVIGNPQLILQKFPSVGKLLGQLYENNIILLSVEVFQSVVRCSLAIANSSSSHESNVSRKAKAWVQTQLRRATAPNLKNSNLLEMGEYLGYSAQESTEMMVDKLVSSLCHDLEVMRSFIWNTEERECYPQKPISGLCIKELSEFCLPLLTMKNAKPLVEKILCCQKSLDLGSSCQENSFCVSDSVSLAFLKAVASSKGLLLSYDARVALWKRYQPSFESEILDLIEMSTVHRPYISRVQLRDAMSSRDLSRACVENPELFAVTMSLLSSFLVRSSGSTQVAKLMSVFGEMCVEESQKGNQQTVSSLPELFPNFCRSLVQKLALNPQDVSGEDYILNNLQSISVELEELTKHLSKSECFAVWKTLWCFPSWETRVLGLSLSSCREEVLDSCINVLCWFHIPPMTDKHISLKVALKEILPPLRLLKSKTRLQFADLQYIVFTSPVLYAPEAVILLGRLLMVFLCDAGGGHLVFSNVVEMLTASFSPVKRLSFMLDCFENSALEKKSSSMSSVDQTKSRQLLLKEIIELLNVARTQLSSNPFADLTATFESPKGDDKDISFRELVARTKVVIAELQSGKNI